MKQLFKTTFIALILLFYTNLMSGSSYPQLNFRKYVNSFSDSRHDLRSFLARNPSRLNIHLPPQEKHICGLPEKLLKSAQVNDFKFLHHQYFRQNNQVFFEQLDLYQFSGFCQYIAQLNGYDDYILGLSNLIKQDKKFRKRTKRIDGFSKWKFHTKIHELAGAVQEKRLAKAQEKKQEKLVQTTVRNSHQNLRLILDDYQILKEELPEECSYQLEKRVYALQQILNGNESWQRRTYRLSSKTIALLKNNNLDGMHWQKCYGNELQNIIHQEFINVTNNATQLYEAATLLIEKDLSITIVQFSDVGICYNQAGLIESAINLSDFCHALLEHIQAAKDGFIQGIQNTAAAILHPVQTSANIFNGVVIVAHCFAKVLINVTKTGILALVDQEQAELRINDQARRIHALCNLVQKYYADKTSHQLTQKAVEIGTELFLMGKCLQVAGNFLQKACLIADTASTRYAQKLLGSHAQAIDVAFESSTQAIANQTCTQLVQQTAPVNTAGFWAAKNTISSSSSASAKVFLSTINPHCINGNTITDYLSKIDSTITTLSTKYAHFAAPIFDPRIGQQIQVTIDKNLLEHIFILTKKTIIKNKGNVEKIHGFHFDHNQELEKMGLLIHTNVVHGPCGSFSSNPIIDGNLYPYKTFFPANWGYKQVSEAIIEALKNLIQPPEYQKSGNLIFSGKTATGIIIEGYIDKNGKILTAYPKI